MNSLKKSKRKKSPKKKGTLKSAYGGTDDVTSVFTKSELDVDDKDKIAVDYFPLQSNTRNFALKKGSILSAIGVNDYDACKTADLVKPDVSSFLKFY